MLTQRYDSPEIGRKEKTFVTVRTTRVSDACDLSVCINTVAGGLQFPLTRPGSSPLGICDYLEFISRKGGAHLVALVGNSIVGWCDIIPWLFASPLQTGRLGIGLLEEYRGQGIGKQLLLGTVQAAFTSSFESIELEVLSSNQRAINLYRRIGFHQQGKKVQDPRAGGRTRYIFLFRLLREDFEGNHC